MQRSFFTLGFGMIVLLFLVGSVIPRVAFAQTPPSAADSVPLSVPIGGVSTITGGLPQYINTWYSYGLGIVTLVAIIMLVYGGFKYLIGATQGDIKGGKTIIEDAIGGMVVLFLAYFILYNINPRTVRLSLPDITRIRSVALPVGSQNTLPGMSCVKDGDCQAGSFCMRTSLVGGMCANGQAGNICRCRGQGCTVTAEQAGGPTNHGGSGRVDCQGNLRCEEVNTNEFICNGGTGAACNLSTRYVFAGNEAVIAGASNTGGAVANNSIVSRIPFGALVLGTSGAVVGGASSVARERQAVTCRESGQSCFQSNEELAGACVFGDYRDMTMFEGVPYYRQNSWLRDMVARCDRTEQEIRALPKADGGCKNITNNSVDEFCIQHRYRCGSGAVCTRSENADAFSATLAYYRSWGNVPVQLRPEYFFQQGCRKPPSAACASDSECSAKCIQGRCSGFGILSIQDGARPTGAFTNAIPNDPALIIPLIIPPGGCMNAWSGVNLLSDARTPDERRIAINTLTQAGTWERFACYPKRAIGQKCDFSAQCPSGATCVTEVALRGPTLPTFNAPLDVTMGIGVCR